VTTPTPNANNSWGFKPTAAFALPLTGEFGLAEVVVGAADPLELEFALPKGLKPNEVEVAGLEMGVLVGALAAADVVPGVDEVEMSGFPPPGPPPLGQLVPKHPHTGTPLLVVQNVPTSQQLE